MSLSKSRTSSRRISSSRTTASTSYPSYPEETSASILVPDTSRTKTRAKTAASTLGGSADQQIICAVTESRGISPITGLAFVNLSTAEAVLCQIADTQFYVKTLHKIHVLEPTQILIPATAIAPTKSKLLQVLETNLGEDASGLTPVDRRLWDENCGVEYIQQLALKEDVEALKVATEGNYFATSSLAATLRYIETFLSISFAFHSMRIKYEPSEGSMMIDLSTIHSLELIQNLQNAKSKDCLFGLLNQTLTPMGARLLRSNILQPLTDTANIEKRYDAIQDLHEREEIFSSVRHALKSFQDFDKVLTEIVVIVPPKDKLLRSEHMINRVLLVKQCVTSIQPVYEALHGVRSELLQKIHRLCAPEMIAPIAEMITRVINEDATYQKRPIDLRNQRTYAVKNGINGLLDVSRQVYKETTHDAQQHVSDLAQTYGLRLEKKFDNSRQFYITFSVSELEDRDAPPEFINIYRKRNIVECQTLYLVKLNQKFTDAHHEVLLMSDRVVRQLIEDIRSEIEPLVRVSEGIAHLDMIASLAQVATVQDYCRPEFTSTLAIKNGRHPMREQIHADKFVPNDVFADTTSRLQILTGCNMSGKSTHIRSIALTTIMAQIGSFVPAAYASLPVRHQLFARVSLDDNATSNTSTFSSEMRETAFILRNVGAGSLVVVDELGRGTSARDGLAIAVAVAEALLASGALVWFVTHFRDAAAVLAERPGVVNLHPSVEVHGGGEGMSMRMLYRIADGPEREAHYGVAMARVVGLPAAVVRAAEKVSKAIARNRERRRRTSKAVVQARRRKLTLGLKQQLVQAKEGSMRGDVLRKWLKRLQDEFVLRMAGLDEEERGAVDADEDGSVISTEIEVENTEKPSSEIDTGNAKETEMAEETKSLRGADEVSLTADNVVARLRPHHPSKTPKTKDDMLVVGPSPTPSRCGVFVMSGAL